MNALTPRREPAPRRRVRVEMRGTVQGVGFRPFAYRVARQMGVAGWIANSPAGVTVEAEGPPAGLSGFLAALRDPPSPAAVTAYVVDDLVPAGGDRFEIRESLASGERAVSVLPDLATCDDCLGELGDPADRRYRYPFITCTRCGPRYSIVEELPYDRARTSMRYFEMCAACRAEYEDPADRRFHAEPIACHDCGPQLALWDADGRVLSERDGALRAAAGAIHDGRIVAVKGIGGFHLLVDARNQAVVGRLRRRKRREEKPFAVMFPGLGAVLAVCDADAIETGLLMSPERPIVLLRRRADGLADAVAPGDPRLGAMLPYAPLHHLLLAELGFPVVATSGNRSDEPIAIDEREALTRLAGIADVFLVHDRPIVRPIDDFVARLVAGQPMLLRRARGFAPALAVVRATPPGILAVGGHLKNTVAVTVAEGIVLGQHVGDLETPEARASHGRAIADLTTLCRVEPQIVARDLHPDYHSTHAAEALGPPVIAVQHHLAHVLAAMAEHDLSGPVLGVVFDGTGYGADGSIWGGEFLAVDGKEWRRIAHLLPFRLPGGEAAVREPRRAALGLLFAAFRREALAMSDLAPVASFTEPERAVLARMLEGGFNAPVTSSAGRLFDGVAALLGLRQRSTYEGQAASALEWAAEGGPADAFYPMPLRAAVEPDAPLVVDWLPALRALLADIRAGVRVGTMARAIHRGLAAAIAEVARRTGHDHVVLSGGCFQNAVLTEAAIAALGAAGVTTRWCRRIPPNDGGIALGQAAWAALHTAPEE